MLQQELNTRQISEILRTDYFTRKIFHGVFARNMLPKKINYPSCLVVNTDNSKGPGEHWIAFFYEKNGFCEFFDPYGLDPKFYGFLSYIRRTSKGFGWNKIQYQPVDSRACGYYCLLYLFIRSRNLNFGDINHKHLNHIMEKFFS